MLSAQVFIMTAYLQAKKRIKHRLGEMAHDDRGEMYAQVAWAVLCIAAAITIVTILYTKWQAAAQNSPTARRSCASTPRSVARSTLPKASLTTSPAAMAPAAATPRAVSIRATISTSPPMAAAVAAASSADSHLASMTWVARPRSARTSGA